MSFQRGVSCHEWRSEEVLEEALVLLALGERESTQDEVLAPFGEVH